MGWDRVSLFKFQEIDKLNDNKKIADEDKVLLSVCTLFNMTEYELDHTEPKRALRLIAKAEKILSQEFKFSCPNRIGIYKLDLDVNKITYGQYVELSFFLNTPHPIQTAHHTLASVSRMLLGKYKTETHRRRSNYFLTQPITKIIGPLNKIIVGMRELNAQYKNLFGAPAQDDTQKNEINESGFMKKFGWVYSASRLAEYNRITLSEAYSLPVKKALGNLTYLKAEDEFKMSLTKK